VSPAIRAAACQHFHPTWSPSRRRTGRSSSGSLSASPAPKTRRFASGAHPLRTSPGLISLRRRHPTLRLEDDWSPAGFRCHPLASGASSPGDRECPTVSEALQQFAQEQRHHGDLVGNASEPAVKRLPAVGAVRACCWTRLLRRCGHRGRVMIHDQPAPISIPVDEAEPRRNRGWLAVMHRRERVGATVDGDVAIDAGALFIDDTPELGGMSATS
jgi:hypothetical protein